VRARTSGCDYCRAERWQARVHAVGSGCGGWARERVCPGVHCAMCACASARGVGGWRRAGDGGGRRRPPTRTVIKRVCDCTLDELKPEERTHVGSQHTIHASSSRLKMKDPRTQDSAGPRKKPRSLVTHKPVGFEVAGFRCGRVRLCRSLSHCGVCVLSKHVWYAGC
jgi:hypothetical protein